jgi:hypothetical protein
MPATQHRLRVLRVFLGEAARMDINQEFGRLLP